MSQHRPEYISALTRELRACLWDDLLCNELEQNRDWAMENLEEACPEYWQSAHWRMAPDTENHMALRSEAESAIAKITGLLLGDLLSTPPVAESKLHSLARDAVSVFFCSTVWGDFGVEAYYMDSEGRVYTLDEFVAYLKTGKGEPLRLEGENAVL